MPSKYIVDTNVPVIAGRADKADASELDCALACAKFIHKLINSDDILLVIDQNYEIIKEYQNNIHKAGQPTLANVFLDWVYQYLARIDISDYLYLNKNGDMYCDFPNNPQLDGFDIADRKFIALSVLHNEHPAIIQGTDWKWALYADVLAHYGVSIEFLCKEYIKRQLEQTIEI